MKKYYLGIDIGTSSVKLLALEKNGEIFTTKCKYENNDIKSWCDALQSTINDMQENISLSSISAVSVSSQVGTYITDCGDVIPWFSDAGYQELKELKKNCTNDEFIREIGMNHPDLISFPLPRLMYIKNNYKKTSSVIMPKEAIIYELTGKIVTDTFSQRGICNPNSNQYSKKLLEKCNINIALPDILSPTDIAGYITQKASGKYLLPQNIPVYIGCNDFYAGLLGMGVLNHGTVFELSGTSEHIGIITKDRIDNNVISGKYFKGYATYGGTKASGVSCDYAIKNYNAENLDDNCIIDNQPIFLPYLRGERAPVFDENAKGVFFGITDKTTKYDMAYAILEGVAFSLYHISQNLPIENIKSITAGGGSTGNKLMAKIKASLFGCDIINVEQNDSSALGAAIIAMVGNNEYNSFEDAISAVVKFNSPIKPDYAIQNKLLSRYRIYENLYISLKDQFKEFSKI